MQEKNNLTANCKKEKGFEWFSMKTGKNSKKEMPEADWKKHGFEYVSNGGFFLDKNKSHTNSDHCNVYKITRYNWIICDKNKNYQSILKCMQIWISGY